MQSLTPFFACEMNRIYHNDRCPDMGAPVRNRTRAARPDTRNLTGEVLIGSRHNGCSVHNT